MTSSATNVARKSYGAALAIALAAAGCSGAAMRPALQDALPQAQARAALPAASGKLKHIVIIIQENRSFDNVFAGYPGALSASSGLMSNGTSTPLTPTSFLTETDMYHTWKAANLGLDHGKMDGFDKNGHGNGNNAPIGKYPYAYLERSEVAPYWDLAREGVLADHMFPDMLGGSFTAHLDLIAATTDLTPKLSELDWPTALPWGCDAPQDTKTSVLHSNGKAVYNQGQFPCFTQFQTLADGLDAAHVSWKYYAPAMNTEDTGRLWSIFDSVRKVRYGPDWTANVVSPQSQVLADAAAGNLASVSWVVPDWHDSDHAGNDSDTGPSWVAAVVNAVGKSKDWNDTAVVVLWDDWGGWYDNAAPPQLDWKGLGIRVPAILISPYAKKGYVSHKQYELSSVVKLVEETFGLNPVGKPAFGYDDTRAGSLQDAFDFTQHPRAFKAIPSKYPTSTFLHEVPSMRAPDDD